MSTENTPLNYLFVVHFKDGSSYNQTDSDASLLGKLNEEGQLGSAFSDIKERLQDVEAFYLVSKDKKNTVGVNLVTGQFIANGLIIDLAPQYFIPVNPLKLIYFREFREDVNVKATIGKDGKTVTSEYSKPSRYFNRYFIGWETKDAKGHGLERTLAVNGR